MRCQGGDHVCGDGFTAADGVNAFVGLSFEVDFFGGDTQRAGQSFAHFREMRAELRFFGDDYGIDVLDGKVAFVEQFFGVLEKIQAIRTLPFRISVRKMRADIAETRRTQKRVTDSVRERVSIRMSDRPFFERDFYAAKNKLAASGEPVQVITNTGSAHRPTSAAIRSRLK